MLCEGILFLIGVVIFITGKVRITGSNLVEGSRAHLIALFFMLPIPLVFVFRQLFERNNPRLFQSEVGFTDASLIELVIWTCCVLVALIIGLTNPAKPPVPPPQSVGLPYAVPPIMTPEEAALYMRVPVSEVYRLIESRQLLAVSIGQQYRISKETIDAMFLR